MPDSDLMFRSAIELASMVRAGEVSSRELVEISLARIDELNPQLNAFVDIDAERGVGNGGRGGLGRRAPIRGCADRHQEQRSREWLAPDVRLFADGAVHRQGRQQRLRDG